VKVSSFDYDLPPELIAQHPAPERQDARLLVLQRATGAISHRCFDDLPDYLELGDLLVLNETRVFPARLYGRAYPAGARSAGERPPDGSQASVGGKLEVLLLSEQQPGCWRALVQPGRRALPGGTISFGDGALQAEVLERTPEGGRLLRFTPGDPQHFWEQVHALGEVPLPHYIRRRPERSDRERYQTVYARVTGSVAAPTAGLHFTQALLDRIRERGVRTAFVLLHVGLGTFRPVSVEDVEVHQMHEEFYRLGPAEASLINETRSRGGRIIAVGTTTVRALESAAAADGSIAAGEDWTRLFIYPGYRFRIVDGLVTNFHLPRSTLLMLVSAFAGQDQVLEAYRSAVAERYRFFSYGDAMLII
jgi:S-adenosylmethionine:tRNA ribosyltransferase-isomerase